MSECDDEHVKSRRVAVLPLEALEQLPEGVVKVNGKGEFTYANHYFKQISGLSEWEGKTIRSVLDEKNYDIVRNRLRSRFSGSGSEEYSAELTHPGNSRKIPVMILAVPEIDECGEVIGSIAVVRDLSSENSSRAIHEAIESETDARSVLIRTAEIVNGTVPFDLFTITLYSKDKLHMRELFSYVPGGVPPQWNVRWWEMPKVVQEFIHENKSAIIDDFVEWLSRPGWEKILEMEATKQFLEQGFRSCVWYPIRQGSEIVAGITLYKRAVKAYSESDADLLMALPLRRVVTMVLHCLEKRDLEFRLDLMRQVSSAQQDGEHIASILVERIADYYGWGNVSIFTVDLDEKNPRFRLKKQKAVSAEFELDPGYTQALNKGVLGHVYKQREPENIGNVATSSLKDVFEPVYPLSVSELAIPIVIDNRVVAILNSEDARENAFSQEEVEGLSMILGELSAFWEKLHLYEILDATLSAAKDSIIVTDARGVIRKLNPAAEKLLGVEEQKAVGGYFRKFIKDASFARFFLEADDVVSQEVGLLRRDGTNVKALFSGSALRGEIGAKVYVGTDLSLRRSSERIELLRDLYHEIAAQSLTPLSLVAGWLHSLKKAAPSESAMVIEKVLGNGHAITFLFGAQIEFVFVRSD